MILGRGSGMLAFVRSLTRPRSAGTVGMPRRAGWRDRLFGRAGEEHFQRRTSDWIRLGTGMVILVIAARHAGDVTATERAIVDLVNTLPRQIVDVYRSLYRLGALW